MSDAEARRRRRMEEHLDELGDLAPPWEAYPDYERYTIGWRMGPGEGWLTMWWQFLEEVVPTMEARLAYLLRHPPAPESWADVVHEVLNPDDDLDGLEPEQREALRAHGLTASDASFPIWLRRQSGIDWPWRYAQRPEEAARYQTRRLWFWSRQVVLARAASVFSPPSLPRAWRVCEPALRRGDASVDLRRGLRSLAVMLAAGRVTPPWQLGLTLDDFHDSFDEDMGFVDAFRLWGMSAFDDRAHAERWLASAAPPRAWRAWWDAELPLD